MEMTINKTNSVHPHKFNLWLFMVSIIMIFAAFTSAYIVRKGEGNWRIVELPSEMWLTTMIIVLSSISVQISYFYSKSHNFIKSRLFLIITLILGFLFLYGQLKVWDKLVETKFFFSGDNPASSFVYILTGLHGFHIVSGLIFLAIAIYSTYNQKINLIRYELCTTYWHFLDALWVYLFFFLIIYHK